jgi:uncharacterized protein (TIGR02145 family)
MNNRKFILIFIFVLLLFSCTEKITYESKFITAKPTINIPAGTYSSPQSVSISCATIDATIRYTTNGAEPTSSSSVYSSPINISTTTTLKARAFKTDWLDSPVAIAEYTFALATPIFDPPSGTFTNPQLIKITIPDAKSVLIKHSKKTKMNTRDSSTRTLSIYYTTNGADPTINSSVYTSPIEINAPTIIKARAFKSGWENSEIATAEYIFAVATPAFNPTSGTYSSAQSVSISCSTSGAMIRYTTNGSNPTPSSPVYSSPIEISSTTTLMAQAYKTSWTDSQIATAEYVITETVANPTLNPPAGTYTTTQVVEMICLTEDAFIHYTTNGSEPTEASPLYSEPIEITATTTLKARAFKSGWDASDTTTAYYIIAVANPTFNPPAGTYTTEQSVEIICLTEDAFIHYTTNGSEPTEASPLYSEPIEITAATTLRARAFKSGWDASDTTTAYYIIAVANPTFNPPAGTYTTEQNVEILCLTENAAIHYTTNGTDPTEASPLYSEPIEVNTMSILKARAFKNGLNASEVIAAEYIIAVANPTFNPPAGSYDIPQEVTISCATENAIIHYTTNGSDPSEDSPFYSDPITISTCTTLKARAFNSSWADSQISAAYYLIADYGSVTDIDGNVYQTLVIGNQEWMIENLKVTHYRNGEPIPNETNEWNNLTTGAYCVYYNIPANAEIYGNLYNWYAVDDVRGLAPEGWRVPSDEDIMELEMSLGMSESEAQSTDDRGTNEGSKLAGGYDLWLDGELRNNPEFDISGFNYLPGGLRNSSDGVFSNMGYNSRLWSSTDESTTNDAWYRSLDYRYAKIFRRAMGKRCGFSVRCVRDVETTKK